MDHGRRKVGQGLGSKRRKWLDTKMKFHEE